MAILIAKCRRLHTYLSELSDEKDSKDNGKQRFGIVRKLELGDCSGRTNPFE